MFRTFNVRSLILLVLLQVGWNAVSAVAWSQDEPSEPPRDYIADVLASADDAVVAANLLREAPVELPVASLTKLQHLDRSLGTPKTDAEREFAREILLVLAKSGEVRSLGYLHQVFETVPERRHDVARAIAEFATKGRRRSPDWRILVRSLPIVDGDDARVVLQSLKIFPHRGTKPQWQREAILAGLRSDDEGMAEAAQLLRHWVGAKPFDGVTPGQSLALWQQWFAEKHPELPEPRLPVDLPTSRYKYAEVLMLLQNNRDTKGDPQRGAEVFVKANCIKCHRFGARGEAMGPDLTNVRQRFQLKELLEATVFPSQAITDQYETTTVVTAAGQVYSGVLAAAGGKIVVLQANGEKVLVDQTEIEESVTSRTSAMPDGLLDPLSLDEIVDLFAYFSSGEN